MKNKKVIRIFSIFALVTAFAACSNDNSNTTEGSSTSIESSENIESNDESVMETTSDESSVESVNDESLAENEMSTESTDPKALNEENITENEDVQMHETDGTYVTTLLASNEGKPIEDIDSGTAYEVNIEDDQLIVKGTFNYREDETDYDNQTLLEEQDNTFKLAEDAEFSAVGGTAPAKMFTRDEFLEYEKEVSDSGLALIIRVEDGLVKSVSISS
ncbi:MAG: hypothetical protein ACTIH2_06070 [Anaerococcus sp.]